MSGVSVPAYFLNEKVLVDVSDDGALVVNDASTGEELRHTPSPVDEVSLDWVVARAADYWFEVERNEMGVDVANDGFGVLFAASPTEAWRKLSAAVGYPFSGRVQIRITQGQDNNPLSAAEVLAVLAGAPDAAHTGLPELALLARAAANPDWEDVLVSVFTSQTGTEAGLAEWQDCADAAARRAAEDPALAARRTAFRESLDAAPLNRGADGSRDVLALAGGAAIAGTELPEAVARALD